MPFLIPSVILIFAKCISAEMSGFIVGGEYSFISWFPHMAFLEIQCLGDFACGASILNQKILLTAAHCLYDCRRRHMVFAYMGDERQKNGFTSQVERFRGHRGFSYDTGADDIAVVKLEKELVLGKKVRRVVLMRNPPLNGGHAFVAGWGVINTETEQRSIYLKHTSQEVWSREACDKELQGMPAGCFCAENRFKNSFPAKGDSGGALVVNNVIQLGVVSHQDLSRPTIQIYTNITPYYDWIQENAVKLYCAKKKVTYK